MPFRLPPALCEVFRDFTRRKNRPWLLMMIGFIVVCAAWRTKLGAERSPRIEPDTIEYHYAQWRHQREILFMEGATNNFNFNKLAWYLDGKPTYQTRRLELERHEAALIYLGYFDDLRFSSQGVDLDRFFNELMKRGRQTHLDETWSIGVGLNAETNITITARKQDLPAIQSLVKQVMRSITNAP